MVIFRDYTYSIINYLLDLFDALPLFNRIIILIIGSTVFIIFYYMFKMIKKPHLKKHVIPLPNNTLRAREKSKAKKPIKKHKKEMKFSGICDFCGREIGGPVKSKKTTLMPYDPERLETIKYNNKEFLDLTFVCSWCGGTFCLDHRLPEQHNCKKLKK